MTKKLQLTRNLFLECNWTYDVAADDRLGYSSVMGCLQKHSKEMLEQGNKEHSEALDLLAR